MLPFHLVSADAHRWISKQPSVKEESLTDRLLFDISELDPRITYHALTRHEEAAVGADWEWWILVDDPEAKGFFAYRFIVQAKKIYEDRDNYPALNYRNKNGHQIDLLLSSSETRGAFPLYLFYSSSHPDIQAQIKNFSNIISKPILRWCQGCINGCYLSPARLVKKIAFSTQPGKIAASYLLNHSFGLSMCDWGYGNEGFVYTALEQLNQHQRDSLSVRGSGDKERGIKYSESDLPPYLHHLIKNWGKIENWFENEFRRWLSGLSGIGVIDLRVK